MGKADLKPAFYALGAGSWRDYVTLLHPPYTMWHLSYVVLGAAAAPVMRLDRLGWMALAFFLAVGLGAHALDELQGRPLCTRISHAVLATIAIFSIVGSLVIGAVAAATISLWVIPFILFGGFVVVAYNLELFAGRFHSDTWFGIAWGAFPALTGYWAMAERLSLEAIVLSAACFALSLAQRTLSKRVRQLRRETRAADGRIEFKDGRAERINVPYLLETPEKALQMMSFTVALLALGLLIARL